MNNKIIVALDVPTREKAKELVSALGDTIEIYKIGMQLFAAEGPDIVKMVHGAGKKVFLDLKFHDIPTTVAKACRAATRLGVFMMNVHAVGGEKMLREAALAVKEEAAACGKDIPCLIGVTVLTSDTQETKTEDLVLARARLCQDAGLNGIVASALEVRVVKENLGDDFIVVTPGIRPAWAATNDQSRITTPRQALDLGADHLVIGRPITAAENPREAAQRIRTETSS